MRKAQKVNGDALRDEKNLFVKKFRYEKNVWIVRLNIDLSYYPLAL